MPERANQHDRSAKKRKTKECCFLSDGYGSNFVPAYGDFCKPNQSKQRSEHPIPNDNCLLDTKQTDACNVPSAPHEGLSLKYPVHTLLKDHMESIMTELKEAREKLLLWMRQEIQAISASNQQVEASRKETAGKRNHDTEYSSNTDSVGAQAALQGVGVCESRKLDIKGPMLDNRKDQKLKLEIDELQVTAVTHVAHADADGARNGIHQKDSELVYAENNSNLADMAISKTLNGMKPGLPSNFNGKDRSGTLTEVAPDQNDSSKLPVDSRNALFDMCFGAGLADDVKDVEGLDGTLESSVTMRESFEFNKASHGMQKGLDGLDRLRETKSALLDMGFDDEGSNEVNGVGCSLESAASSKVNSALSKAGKGIQGVIGGGNDAWFASRFAEKGKEHTPVGSSGAYVPIKVNKEVLMGMEANKELVSRSRGGRPGDESRSVDPLMVGTVAAASLKGSSHLAGGFPAQSSQVGDAYEQARMNARSGCGIKRPRSTAMTFKGSALESKNEGIKPSNENRSFTDVYNSATSSVVLKDNAQLPTTTTEKGKVEPLVFTPQHARNSVSMAGSAPAWSMFSHAASKNSMDQILHDAKIAHLEYASRSKLGDSILGSTGTTLNLQGLDPIFGCSPTNFKLSNEMMEAYQQDRANPSASSYFSSLCMSNGEYLPASNMVMGMQRQLQTAPPSSSAAYRSMLLGMPGHIGGHHHEPSSLHTFLGLGMNNGVPSGANGMQVLPGLYLQSNQQNTQLSFKQGPSSSSAMVTHRESSASQEKAVLELNF